MLGRLVQAKKQPPSGSSYRQWRLRCFVSEAWPCGMLVVVKSCLTLCDRVDYSPPDSSVHGISQARALEWVAISFSRGSS